jgi:hypothetical protein
MTKTINLHQDIDHVMLTDLITFFNANNKSDNFLIYLSSDGGNPSEAEAILNYLDNLTSEGYDIKLIGYDTLFSSAFLLYMKFKYSKEITYGTVGMFHYPSIPIKYNVKKPISIRESFHKEWIDQDKIDLDKFIDELNITDKEKKLLKSGNDVYFDYFKMLKITNNGIT